MLNKTVNVTSFRGQCYGFEGRPIRIAFHDDYGPVAFEKGKDFHGIYHIDDEDIIILNQQYPKRIPEIGNLYYDSVVDWGYDVEDQLYKLMLFEKVQLPREEDGVDFLVTYKWVGPFWDAEKQRKATPRRKGRNPHLDW